MLIVKGQIKCKRKKQKRERNVDLSCTGRLNQYSNTVSHSSDLTAKEVFSKDLSDSPSPSESIGDIT